MRVAVERTEFLLHLGREGDRYTPSRRDVDSPELPVVGENHRPAVRRERHVGEQPDSPVDERPLKRRRDVVHEPRGLLGLEIEQLERRRGPYAAGVWMFGSVDQVTPVRARQRLDRAADLCSDEGARSRRAFDAHDLVHARLRHPRRPGRADVLHGVQDVPVATHRRRRCPTRAGIDGALDNEASRLSTSVGRTGKPRTWDQPDDEEESSTWHALARAVGEATAFIGLSGDPVTSVRVSHDLASAARRARL